MLFKYLRLPIVKLPDNTIEPIFAIEFYRDENSAENRECCFYDTKILTFIKYIRHKTEKVRTSVKT